ncbi:PREDICTED: uncharacterized protein LOC109159386 [Ipomoea nil]|uniref:uncharacterized protein LOC109159386 n=1 Tax=Ipomoea nil TaxID=35883 RepID=UPI0009011DFD|nr:PREDICTED: uncharacterized protein LOC109159386 [Ipomoea nil]
MLSKYRPSSPFPSPSSCFRASPAAASDLYESSPAPAPAPPTLATSLYRTGLGLFAVTWSRDLLGRSFHLHFLLDDSSAAAAGESSPRDFYFSSLSGAPSFHFRIKPFMFSKKQGSKKLQISSSGGLKNANVFWDLSRAKFGSGPEPVSGFYIAVLVGGETVLLIGDCQKEAYAKTRARHAGNGQALVLKREHVYGGKLYATKANVGGKERRISIDCRVAGDDPGLVFSMDDKKVLQIKHLKWKFRGNERIEVEGFPIQVSWDVHSWLFDDDEDGYALFTFKFEKQSVGEDGGGGGFRGKMVNGCGLGFETMLMKKGLLRSSRSSSSSSLSSTSASSSCTSVMEWESAEENELKDPPGFSLLVYAWKS